jgi:RNA polymerase sigma-70 factor (ECF subfamily)
MGDGPQFGALAASPSLTPEERIDQQTRAEVVRRQIGTLPPKQRKAIEMAYFQGLSQSEIAEALGEPLGTVKTWIRGALARLRDGLVEVGYGV